MVKLLSVAFRLCGLTEKPLYATEFEDAGPTRWGRGAPTSTGITIPSYTQEYVLRTMAYDMSVRI